MSEDLCHNSLSENSAERPRGICRGYAAGDCRFGSRCLYAHQSHGSSRGVSPDTKEETSITILAPRTGTVASRGQSTSAALSQPTTTSALQPSALAAHHHQQQQQQQQLQLQPLGGPSFVPPWIGHPALSSSGHPMDGPSPPLGYQTPLPSPQSPFPSPYYVFDCYGNFVCALPDSRFGYFNGSPDSAPDGYHHRWRTRRGGVWGSG